MPTFSPPIATIVVNGHTYTNTDFEANPLGTFANIANDFSTIIAALSLVGVLTKAISGNVTLTGGEAANIGFIFTGALSADATITFPSSYKGICQVINRTTGSHTLFVWRGAGAVASVAPGGTATQSGATLFCDGTDFLLIDGVQKTASGARTLTDFTVNGAATVTGALSAGVTNLTGTLTTTGNLNTGAGLNVNGTTALTGAVNTGGTLFSAGSLNTGSDLNALGNSTITGTLTIGGAISAGGTAHFGGTVSAVASSGEAHVKHDSVAGQAAWSEYDTAGLARWLVGKNNTAEGGSNAGSDYAIGRYADDGTSALGVPLKIRRSDGAIILDLPTSAPSGSGALWRDGVDVKIV